MRSSFQSARSTSRMYNFIHSFPKIRYFAWNRSIFIIYPIELLENEPPLIIILFVNLKSLILFYLKLEFYTRPIVEQNALFSIKMIYSMLFLVRFPIFLIWKSDFCDIWTLYIISIFVPSPPPHRSLERAKKMTEHAFEFFGILNIHDEFQWIQA